MQAIALSHRTVTVSIKLESDEDIAEFHRMLAFLENQNRLPGSLDAVRIQLKGFVDGVI